MANEIYDSSWWGNTIETASSIGTSTEMIQGQFNMNDRQEVEAVSIVLPHQELSYISFAIIFFFYFFKQYLHLLNIGVFWFINLFLHIILKIYLQRN